MTRTVRTAMATHLVQANQRMVTCWRVTLRSGTVLGFTACDIDIIVAGWTGVDAQLNGTYLAAFGYQATDTSTTGALNVDNMDVIGPMTSSSINEADLNAGLWDYARIVSFQVSWDDLTRGPIWQRVGHLGEVSFGLDAFRAELRGLTSAYNTTRIGKITSAGCRHVFGSQTVGNVPGCNVDLGPLTVISTITRVNTDGVTLYDTARTEPGPTGGVAIVAVGNSNPGVVQMADASLALIDKQLITLSGIGGMPLLNVVTQAISPSGVFFNLSIDTSDTAVYGTYTSGGLVDVFEGDTGFFDGGVITFTSGLNIGISREVKSYVPGQITLWEPFPYDVVIGDAYTMTPGCDKTEATCFARYSNVVNMDAEPWLAGIDKMIQVGRHNG